MTPDDLVEIHRIEQLKHRYLRALDDKDWEGFAAVFTDDATAHYGDRLRFEGPAQIVDYMRDNLGPDMVTMHQVHQPEITVTGDMAEGLWSLQDKVIMVEHRLILEGCSAYRDTYRLVNGEWRIAHTGYRRRYEYLFSFDDLPGFRLTAGGGG